MLLYFAFDVDVSASASLCCFSCAAAFCSICGCFWGRRPLNPTLAALETFQNVKNNETIDETPLTSEMSRTFFQKKSILYPKKFTLVFCIPKKRLLYLSKKAHPMICCHARRAPCGATIHTAHVPFKIFCQHNDGYRIQNVWLDGVTQIRRTPFFSAERIGNEVNQSNMTTTESHEKTSMRRSEHAHSCP